MASDSWYQKACDDILARNLVCPLCGGKLIIEPSGHDDESVNVRCTDCTLMGGHYYNEIEARLIFIRRDANADLLPCPLCGGKVEYYESELIGWEVLCRRCAYTVQSFISREDLKKLWNNRKGQSNRGKYKRANKLNNGQAKNARNMVSSGIPIARVARMFGVSRQTMYKVINKTGGYREDEEDR